ncbi:hypothetical protein SUDANB1_08018 [Streptomyces sp. enrichment culture]
MPDAPGQESVCPSTTRRTSCWDALLHQHPQLRGLRGPAERRESRGRCRTGRLGRALRLGPCAAPASPGASLRGPLDAVDGGRTGDLTHSAGHPADAGPPLPSAATRPPGRHPGPPQRRPGDLRRGSWRSGRGRVPQFRRHRRPARARRAPGRGAGAAAALLDRRAGEPPRPALRGRERDAAARHRAAAGPARVDRRVLAAPPTHAAGGPLGRRGTALRDGPARSRTRCGRSTGTGRIPARAPAGRLRASLRAGPGRRHTPGRGQGQGCHRSPARRRGHLVGRAADPDRPRSGPAGPGAAPHRGRPTGSSRCPRAASRPQSPSTRASTFRRSSGSR